MRARATLERLYICLGATHSCFCGLRHAQDLEGERHSRSGTRSPCQHPKGASPSQMDQASTGVITSARVGGGCSSQDLFMLHNTEQQNTTPWKTLINLLYVSITEDAEQPVLSSCQRCHALQLSTPSTFLVLFGVLLTPCPIHGCCKCGTYFIDDRTLHIIV